MNQLKVLLLAALFLLPVTAQAAVGVAFELGGGEGSFDENVIINSVDVDTAYANVSFLFDSDPYAVYGNSSYRLNIGFERHDYDDEFNNTLETTALIFDNTLAFKFIQTPDSTVWFGPQLRIGFMDGETEAAPFTDPIEFSGAMFGVGIAFGTNIRTADNMGISLSGGLRRTGLAGENRWLGFEDDYTGRTSEGYINFALLFD